MECSFDIKYYEKLRWVGEASAILPNININSQFSPDRHGDMSGSHLSCINWKCDIWFQSKGKQTYSLSAWIDFWIKRKIMIWRTHCYRNNLNANPTVPLVDSSSFYNRAYLNLFKMKFQWLIVQGKKKILLGSTSLISLVFSTQNMHAL